MEIIKAKKVYTTRIQSLVDAILDRMYEESVERGDLLAALEIAIILVKKIPCRPEEA